MCAFLFSYAGVSATTQNSAGGTCSGTDSSWLKSIEIHTLKGGELRKSSNYPLTLTIETATIPSVAAKISAECFDNSPVVLLDHDNLKIPHNACTQGTCTVSCPSPSIDPTTRTRTIIIIIIVVTK